MRVKDGERVISKLFTIIELFLINNSVTSDDIVKHTVNKANGVDFVYKLLKNNNQSIDKILVAGDSNNDIEMIKRYDGYAQINANEKIKAITDKYFNFISDIIYKEL